MFGSSPSSSAASPACPPATPPALNTALSEALQPGIRTLVEQFQLVKSRDIQEIHFANYVEEVVFWLLEDAQHVPHYFRECLWEL